MSTKEVSRAEYEVYKADFDAFDTNHNGVIDTSELRALADQQLERQCSDQEFAEFISDIDLDRNNKIEFREYLTCVLGRNWRVKHDDRNKGRDLLGISVHALKTHFTKLCAARGFPLEKEQEYGFGGYKGVRRPTVHDIKESLLLDYTGSMLCTRDGQPGCALIDAIEERHPRTNSVQPANLMLSYSNSLLCAVPCPLSAQ
eukprot:TRINITY_DN15955_c0_g1_i4.p2 TRINITY_DN15955_c0_g1~~TRINITY_DN15955_c0_g1_i4.p2  ORF type:complete len:201 (+),score=50.77 TRINITY_DN15955_c0_g1_i4:69-671(+)